MRNKELLKLFLEAGKKENDPHLSDSLPGMCILLQTLDMSRKDKDKLLYILDKYKPLIPKCILESNRPYWFPISYWQPRIEFIETVLDIESSFWKRLLFKYKLYKSPLK